MSNNLLHQANLFGQDFDQSLFFFRPKQFTFDLKLDDLEIVNTSNPFLNFNSEPIKVDFIDSKNTIFEFNTNSLSVDIIRSKSSKFSFSGMGINLGILTANKTLNSQFTNTINSNIVFVRESFLSISISI
jgi:hypothetical protein